MEEAISDHLAACSPFADCFHWSNSYYNRLQWSLWIWTTSGGRHKYDIAQLVLVRLGEFYRLLREWLWERRTKPQYWDRPFFARNKGVNIEPEFSCCALRQYHKVTWSKECLHYYSCHLPEGPVLKDNWLWLLRCLIEWNGGQLKSRKKKNGKFINSFLSDPLGNKGHSLKDFATPA